MSADEAQRVDSARVRGLVGFHLRHLTNSTDIELSINNRKKLEEAQTGGCKNTRIYLKIEISSYADSVSFRLVRNLSLFSEGFPTHFACGNDSFQSKTDFEIGSTYP